jgi:hypothetical protein
MGMDGRNSEGSPEMIEPPRAPLGHKLMFIILSLLAFCLFAPAVMLPKLRDYGQLLVEEQKLKRKVAELNDEVRHRAELAEAFARDAIVNERLAVLDLGYRKPNEEVFAVMPGEPLLPEPMPADTSTPRSALLLPDDWPTWAQDAEIWANDRGIVDLFLDPNLHAIFLLMSGGLIVAAFVLFAPRVRRNGRMELGARPCTVHPAAMSA